ncbi:MAG TPA: hypothetical protein VNB94_07740 [Mycobacteriales bacterium]|nr:hypothetical protein [Mycobacteriales bacterium]
MLSFVGNAPRLWTVPLLYTVVEGDRLRLLAQALLAAAAWLLLAREMRRWVSGIGAARTVSGLVLVLGLTQQVIQWNTALLSESLAITTCVGLLTATMLVVRRRSWTAVAIWMLLFILWVFTRQAHAMAGGLLLLPTVAYACTTRVMRWKAATMAVGIALVAAWGLAATARGGAGITRLSAALVIKERLLTDPERLAYFAERGLPLHAVSEDLPFSAITSDPGTAAWIDDRWTATYTRYLLTHPSALAAPLQSANTDLSDDVQYTGVQPVLPPTVEGLIFGEGTFVFYALLAGAALVRQSRRRALEALEWLGLTALLFGISWYSIVWFNAPVDIARLAAPMSVLVRLALLLVLLPTALEVARLARAVPPRWPRE